VNPTDFFRRLQMVLTPLTDDLHPECGGQIIINIATGGKVGSVELRKVVKNPE